jgi:hypothetical protein
MTKANQLVVEVLFVPLSAAEIEDRRKRLRVLLIRGALRVVQYQSPNSPPPPESIRTELTQK